MLFSFLNNIDGTNGINGTNGIDGTDGIDGINSHHTPQMKFYYLLQGVNIFQLHLDDFLWKHFGVCQKAGCKWCQLQQDIDITNLDEHMNGRALKTEFGGLSAKAMFKKLGWTTTTPPPTTTKTEKVVTTRTNELVEQWKKNKTEPRQKKCRLEKPSHPKEPDEDDDDLFLSKFAEKRKKK